MPFPKQFRIVGKKTKNLQFHVNCRITDFFQLVPSCGGSAISPSHSIDTVILDVHDNLWEQQEYQADG